MRRDGRSLSPFLKMQEAVADGLVASKIRDKVGGRLRLAVSGSAPLPAHIASFFNAVGVPLIEGYGLTETSPVITVNPLDKPRFGSVGCAIDGVEVAIADDGEILTRGPHVMKGYWNRPDDTAAVLQPDGWFHTGDIGALSDDGYLTITDRKKELLVTSGGKKIAPAPIEALLKRHPLVAEAMIVGEARKFPAVLIVPNFTALEHRLKLLGRPTGTREALVAPRGRGVAVQRGRRTAQSRPGAVRATEEGGAAAGRVQHRDGRADADAQAAAPGRPRALAGRRRQAVRDTP